jgi:uncharacterized protein
LYSGLAIAAGGLLVWVNVNFKIESSEGDLLAGQSNLNHAAEVLQQEFFGEKEIECIVDLQGRDVWSPEVLQALNDLENHVEELMKPLYISSPVVVAKRYHRYTRNGRQEAFSLPEQFSASSRKEIQKHLGDLGAGAMVADDGQHVKMTIGFVDPSLEHRRLTYEKLEEYVADMSKSGIAIELTGKSYISDRGTYRFTIKVLIGLLVGLFGASVVVFLVLKSAQQSLGLLVVNLFPVLAVVGLMLLADIHLTAESLFFLSLLAGICIDDSIYLITQKRKSRSTHIFPIAVTSVVLAAGFIALGCSSFLWLRPFAWIFLVGITLAYLMDMFVLPLFLLATSDGERDSG